MTEQKTTFKKEMEILTLFNEKAQKLFNLSFVKKLINLGYSFKYSEENKKLVGVIKGPDDEAIDAFINTLRFFIQDNEPSSQRNIDGLYNNLNIPNDLKKDFKNARRATNKFLDSKSIFTINGNNITNRKIFNVFIYGGISHSNHKKEFDAWQRNFLLFTPLKNEFVTILSLVLNNIMYIKNVNLKVIEYLNKNAQTKK